MAGMKNHEQTFNAALGAVLQTRRRDWRDRVATEMSGGIVGGGRADNLIYPDNMQPVAVEAAFANSPDVDSDAIARLGKEESHHRRDIMTAVAVAIPESVKKIKRGVDGMKAWLQKGGMLKYAVYSLVKGEGRELPGGSFDVRYPDGKPNSGYLRGTAADLADLIELAATPDKKIKQAAESAGGEVRGIGAQLMDGLPDFIRHQIAEKVGQPPDAHAMRVAACVWLNAMTLHGKLAAVRKNISPPRECKTLRQVANAWEAILRIDYHSVFRPALESLELLSDHGELARNILENLHRSADALGELRLGAVADVSSDMFPELATDRKSTAAFYTRMEAAELLAGLAFHLIPDDGHELKIADFACGTGALLKATYRQVRRRAEPKSSIDMSELHRKYMEDCLHGADIQPIAAHLTAAGLASMRPQTDYKHANIICADVRNGKTGSLDLLKSEALEDLFGVSSITAIDGSRTHNFRPADGTFDLCIMNPPYSRTHGESKTRGGGRVFGVEGLPQYQRKESLENLGKLLTRSFANRKAGMASAFCLLADRKLKPGGVLALVLPLSAAGQGSWRKLRTHIMQNYSDIVIVGLAAEKLQSFSAETNMGEILICARKGGKSDGKLTFVNLLQLPRNFLEAHEVARAMGGALKTGELKVGEHVYATCVNTRPGDGDSWGAAAAKSDELPAVAEKIVAGEILNLGLVRRHKIGVPMLPLSQHKPANSKHRVTGPTHHLIGHITGKGDIGAFAFRDARQGDSSNLSLWAANYKTQTRMICAPTHRGVLMPGREKSAEEMLDKHSTLFLPRGLSFASQKPAAAMTEKPCMGGRGWNALILQNSKAHAAYCLWFNSILGLLCRWQCGGRQQPGRAQMQLGDIKNFPCPAFAGKTTDAQKAVKIANKEFPRLAKLNLMPCSYAWRDSNRKKIDKVVLRMLGLEKKLPEDDMQALRKEWCREPSVHGGNKSVLNALRTDKLL